MLYVGLTRGLNIYDIMYKIRNDCKLELEPQFRQQVYKGLENEGKLFDILYLIKILQE